MPWVHRMARKRSVLKTQRERMMERRLWSVHESKAREGRSMLETADQMPGVDG